MARKKAKQMSKLLSESKELYRSYKQMTPTRDGSTLETMRYAWKNRDSTYKMFGVIDTGQKDYGMKPHRNPLEALRMMGCLTRMQRIQKDMEKDKKRKRRR